MMFPHKQIVFPGIRNCSGFLGSNSSTLSNT